MTAQPCIAIGSQVHLKAAPFGRPGQVLQQQRGKLLVRWTDLNLETRHSAERLCLASNVSRETSPMPANESR